MPGKRHCHIAYIVISIAIKPVSLKLNFLTEIIAQNRSFEVVTELDKDTAGRKVMDFYKRHQPTREFNALEPLPTYSDFEEVVYDGTHFSLPIQFGFFNFSTNYRLTGNLQTNEQGTQVAFEIKDDPYWVAANIITPIAILAWNITDPSTLSVVVSGFVIIVVLLRWLRTSERLTQIESELKEALEAV